MACICIYIHIFLHSVSHTLNLTWQGWDGIVRTVHAAYRSAHFQPTWLGTPMWHDYASFGGVIIIRTLYSILDYLLLGAYDQHVPTGYSRARISPNPGFGPRCSKRIRGTKGRGWSRRSLTALGFIWGLLCIWIMDGDNVYLYICIWNLDNY